jgi:N-acetylglutamate synthase-like GNAT family acetyltransferase
MSDPRLDQLAEFARNRGLKLVRSRVRTAGKPGFGKVGVTNKNGKAKFGMDAQGPTATPEEVEAYLRNLGAQDWGASLDVAVLPRKREPAKVGKPRAIAANDREPAPKPKLLPKPAPPPPKPKPEPKPQVRAARPGDAPALAELIKSLGHEIDEKTVRKNIAKLTKEGEAPLVATLDKAVIGLCGIHRMVTVHRPAPVGRITVLVVAENAQDKGIGRMLVEEAERLLKQAGCQMVEVTSNDRLGAAHAFYRHLGYDRTSIRFMKKL